MGCIWPILEHMGCIWCPCGYDLWAQYGKSHMGNKWNLSRFPMWVKSGLKMVQSIWGTYGLRIAGGVVGTYVGQIGLSHTCMNSCLLLGLYSESYQFLLSSKCNINFTMHPGIRSAIHGTDTLKMNILRITSREDI